MEGGEREKEGGEREGNSQKIVPMCLSQADIQNVMCYNGQMDFCFCLHLT